MICYANPTKATPSVEALRELLVYEPETGLLFWRPRGAAWFRDHRRAAAWNARYAGTEALTVRRRGGYLAGYVLRKDCKAHRVAWALSYGAWPIGEIDHINGDAGDNRIANLREVTRIENCRNMSRRRCNSSGVIGVMWSKRQHKWLAKITVNYRVFSLGSYQSFDEAVAVRKRAERQFGFHENHGRYAGAAHD